jgi:PAS domain S-box-containing protein
VQNDITRRKEAEGQRSLMLQVVVSAHEAVVITEAQLELPGPRIRYVNEVFSRMTGYAPKEVIGKTPRIFQGPRTDRTVLERMRRQLAQGRELQGGTINHHKDGSIYVLAWHVALTVADDNGQGFVQGSDAAGRSGGVGLRLMAYRARLVGAQLEISSRLEEGTVVTCTFDPKSMHPL